MANQGYTHRIIKKGSEEGRSFEDYGSLHRYASFHGSKKFREYIANCTPTVTDGGGTAKAVASSTAVSDKGKTELTLVLAADTDDVEYDGQSVIIYYQNAAGDSKAASAAYNVANSTTEVAFTDLATGLVAVADFYCFDQDKYGVGTCVISSVVAQAGDNICIGITGLVAGIADPEICFAHINAAKDVPLLADIYGVGSIWGEREADDTDDDALVSSIIYLTPAGKLKEATCTNTTTHTTIIRYVDENGAYVGDFYRVRILETTQNLVKAHHVCDHDGATHYAVIEALSHVSCHTSYFACKESDCESYLGMIYCGWSITTDTCTIKITYTPYGDTIGHVRQRIFKLSQFIQINERLAPATEVTMTIQDSGVAAGLCTVEALYIDVSLL